MIPRRVAYLVAAALAIAYSSVARAQEVPKSLRDRALSIQIQAVVIPPSGDLRAAPSAEQSSWHEEGTGLTVPGNPVGIKLVAKNVVIMVQVTPFDREEGHLTLVVQGQVWLRKQDGSLSFRTIVNKVEVVYGETVFFYPLGTAPKGKPTLRVAIAVTKAVASGTSGGTSGVSSPGAPAPSGRNALPGGLPAGGKSGK